MTSKNSGHRKPYRLTLTEPMTPQGKLRLIKRCQQKEAEGFDYLSQIKPMKRNYSCFWAVQMSPKAKT